MHPKNKHNSVGNWLNHNCFINKHFQCDKNMAYVNYQLYCVKKQMKPVDVNMFNQYLNNNGIDYNSDSLYCGITLKKQN